MPSPLRDEFRTITRDRIKSIARARLEADGPTGISLRAIAAEMGVTAPSLYRYYESRESLITAMVTDGYASLADALTGVPEDVPPQDRLALLAHAYRNWALEAPSRFLLLFGTPIPGYDARGTRTTQTAVRAWTPFIGAIAAGFESGDFRFQPPPSALAFALGTDTSFAILEPALATASFQAWAHLHGSVMLELTNQTTFLRADDAMFEANLAAIIAGLRGGWRGQP